MRNILTIGLLPVLLLACNPTQNIKDPIEDRQEARGKISVPLTATSSSGKTYRLELPSIMLTSENEILSLKINEAAEINESLREGKWKLFIDEGWVLYRVDADTEVPVDAELIGDNPQSFEIHAGESTNVLIQFKTILEEIEFQDGDLEISIVIEDEEQETVAEETVEESEETEEPEADFSEETESDEDDTVEELEIPEETEEGLDLDDSAAEEADNTASFANECNGQICLAGPLEEGFGFVAAGRGHDISSQSNSSFYSFGADACRATGSTQAFYSFATMDYHSDSSAGGVYGQGIGDNFSNLRLALHNQGASINDLTVSFGFVDLGEDIEGQDYIFFSSELEWRYYANNDASVVEIKFNGEAMLIGTMADVHLELDYNEASDCSDDHIRAYTEPVLDLRIAPDAPEENVLLGQALLQDSGEEGVWFSLENSNSPITRDQPFFEADNAQLGIGPMNF